jgi:hypothetical protein
VKEIRHNPLLWLLAFVPLVFASVYFLTEVALLLAAVAAYRLWSKGAPLLNQTARPGGIRT